MNNLQLTNYDIIRLLGEGGMSFVYLARHRLFQQEVAVKVLKQEFIKNGNIKGRFLAEAKSLFVMSHINIVRVTDLIDQENMVAYIMEYIQGWSLKDYLENNCSLKDEDIQRMISQMLDALSYVHGQGLVHRDIKPANIFITRGGIVKLMDFGIAKRLGGSLDYDPTVIHQTMGTTMYMSPEQIKSTKDVTYLSDLYSLGVVLWEMVTGRKPYDDKTSSSHEIQSKIVNEKLPLTGTRWDIIIGGSTVKDEGGRYRSAKEFRAAVERLIHGEPPRPDDRTVVEEVKSGKTASVSQIIAALMLLGVLIGGYVIWSWWKESSGEEQERIEKQEISVELSTRTISSIKEREAMSGGIILRAGSSGIIAKGLVWSKSVKPEISLSTKTNEGRDATDFSSKLTNLSPDTRYYVRAYATTSSGTEYGDELTFVTQREVITPSGTVSVGSQVWQTKNLNVDRFRNGDLIPQAQSAEAWKKAGDNQQPAWCYYDNNPENGKIYGKLYNWYAVNDRRGICPQGWHVPSDTEWTKLTNYLGGEEMAGGKMKSKGLTYWDSPNKDATNESGFSALPGGYRDGDGSFNDISSYAFFWSATEYDYGSFAWGRGLYNYNGDVNRYISFSILSNDKSVGASVRCLRD